jgi:disulfide bond formation protein DsbB
MMLGTRRWPNNLSQDALVVAWAASCAGLVVSLYFSEVRGWMPCALCWYQRICLWPLALVLSLAWYRKRPDIITFVLPQVAVGTLIATYQILIQDFLHADVLGLCPTGPSCVTKVNVGLGPISIPMMSWAAHVATGLLLLAAWYWRPRAVTIPEPAAAPGESRLALQQGGA